MEAICRGKNLYLFKLSDGDSVSVMTPMDQLPRYHGAVHIDLEACVAMAFQGLREIGHDPFSSSRPKEYSEEEAAELDKASAEYLAEHPELVSQTNETAE